MPTNVKTWAKSFKKRVKDAVYGDTEDYIRRYARDFLTKAMELSPKNSGDLRYSWQVSLNSSSGDKNYGSEEGVLAAAEGALKSFRLGQLISFNNPVPYARVYDKGLFTPSDPGPSSGRHAIPKSRIDELRGKILIRGGFHVSAQEGMSSGAINSLRAAYPGIQ